MWPGFDLIITQTVLSYYHKITPTQWRTQRRNKGEAAPEPVTLFYECFQNFENVFVHNLGLHYCYAGWAKNRANYV